MRWSQPGLWAFFVVGGLIGGFFAVRKNYRDTAEVVVKFDPSAFYLPSPVEIELLEPELEIWPRVFNAARPLEPELVPELYTAAARSGRVARLSAEELEAAREWSVMLNRLDLETLAAKLPVYPDPQTVLAKRSLQSCSLWEREVLYRWSQVKPALAPDFLIYLNTCDPRGVLKYWLTLKAALESGDRTRIEQALPGLRERSLVPDKSWAMWFAGKAVSVGERALEAR